MWQPKLVHSTNQLGKLASYRSVKVSLVLSMQASTSADGTLKIWMLEKKECLKTVICLPKFSDVNFSHPLARIAWEEHYRSAVVVPCGRAGIKLFSYGTWAENATLCCSGEPKVTYTVTGSKCLQIAQYLCIVGVVNGLR